ncbi:MAG TPA: IS1634 family transposase [Firmicutes bacterium]|jgi:transposase|nr:IS1634 family transposase [Bacillota bacterium]
MQVSAKHPGAANLMAHLCSELDIARFVNNMVTWDEKQWKVSPGTLVTALVINTLVQRTALYNVERFYAGMDMPLLFSENIQAEDLNDDALGRALDRLAEIDCRQLLGTVACGAARIENMDIRSVHADTTSFSVYGDYEVDPSKDDSTQNKFIEIVHGYSKDKRPDLKQFKYGLMVTKEGFPIVGDVVSGNQNDGVWNKEILKEFQVSFLETWNVVYVADSALITEENVKAMHDKNVRFISLLPGRYKLAQELRDKAWQTKKWIEHGPLSKSKDAAHYWTQSLEAEFAGRIYRFVAVRSSKLDKRKEKKLESLLKAEHKELQELKKKLEKEKFQCKPDAKSKLEAILKDHNMLHKLTGRIIKSEVKKRRPGRPRKDQTLEPTPKIITTYGIELEIHAPSSQALNEWRQREATFVLITSVSADRFDNYDILKEYKGQINVEMRFRFLKDPMFVNAIFLKTPKRVQALGYVILLAVMIAALLEIRIREALKNEQETVTGPGKRVLHRPTARVLLDMLNTIQVVYLTYDDRIERHLPQNIDPDTLRLLKFAGYDEQIYIRNPYHKLS